MPRGGKRTPGPGKTIGGVRKGAGRKPGPRLTPEQATALVVELAGTGTRAALAERLGVTPQALSHVCAHGMTEQQAAEWRRRCSET
jgi:hypothetical protein